MQRIQLGKSYQQISFLDELKPTNDTLFIPLLQDSAVYCPPYYPVAIASDSQTNPSEGDRHGQSGSRIAKNNTEYVAPSHMAVGKNSDKQGQHLLSLFGTSVYHIRSLVCWHTIFFRF